MKRPRAVGISFDFMQNDHGYSHDAKPLQTLPNNSANQWLVVSIKYCNELVSLMTAKPSECVSSIFEATRMIAILDISNIDVFKGKMLRSIFKKSPLHHLDSVSGSRCDFVNRQST